MAVLVEHDGRVRARKVDNASAETLKANLREHVDTGARIMTDEWVAYRGLDQEFAGLEAVDHGHGEYVRGEAHTNTTESWIALLRRGIYGTFHHVSEEHLNRYADEFSFRWDYHKSADGERFVGAIKGAKGKRLYYKNPTSKP